MALPLTKLTSTDDFEKFLAGSPERERRYELIDGYIVEKSMPTDEHSLIIGVAHGELYIYCRANNLGLPGPEHRFQVPGDYKNSRLPDLSLIVDPDYPITTKDATQRPPDFILEVKSSDDNYDDLRERARSYIANGVRLVWLAFPRERIIEVYRPDVPSLMLTIDDTLEGYDVLPGFTLEVAKLFVTKRSG
ncbi:MAG: Uma2 family endonuclease [Anaerolineae bacterium]